LRRFSFDDFGMRTACRELVTAKLTRTPFKLGSTHEISPVFTHSVGRRPNNVYVPAGIHHFIVPLVNFIDTAHEAFPPHPYSITPVIGGPNSIHSTEARNISSFDRSVTHLFATVGGVAIPEKRTIFSSCGQFLFRSRDRAAKHTCNASE